MTALLCVAPRCRAPRQHRDGCTDDTCRGCLPHQAADGLQLCERCTGHLADNAVAAGELYDELELRLVAATAAGERVTGTLSAGLGLNDAAVEARDDIRAKLASWCLLVAQERGIGTPADIPAAMGRWLSTHARWLAAHPAARDAADEMHDLARGRPYGIAYPTGARTIEVGHCPHDGCAGRLVAKVRATDSLLPSAVTCDNDGTHTWPADQWHALGRLIERKKVAV
jgi:hypothetical protein